MIAASGYTFCWYAITKASDRLTNTTDNCVFVNLLLLFVKAKIAYDNTNMAKQHHISSQIITTRNNI